MDSCLCLLAPQTRTERDFTQPYLTKLKAWRKLNHKHYHVPLEGSRIFIRVWQQVNGWENELGLFQASALVPLNEDRWRVSRPRQAQIIRKQ